MANFTSCFWWKAPIVQGNAQIIAVRTSIRKIMILLSEDPPSIPVLPPTESLMLLPLLLPWKMPVPMSIWSHILTSWHLNNLRNIKIRKYYVPTVSLFQASQLHFALPICVISLYLTVLWMKYGILLGPESKMTPFCQNLFALFGGFSWKFDVGELWDEHSWNRGKRVVSFLLVKLPTL